MILVDSSNDHGDMFSCSSSWIMDGRTAVLNVLYSTNEEDCEVVGSSRSVGLSVRNIGLS